MSVTNQQYLTYQRYLTISQVLLGHLSIHLLIIKLDQRGIKAALANFPKRSGPAVYNAAHDGTMVRITSQPPGFRDLARKALSWISLAQRHLSVQKIQHALVIQLEDKDFDKDSIQDHEIITQACAGLAVVDQEIGAARSVLHTTHEFFSPQNHGSILDVSPEIAIACIDYLLFDAILPEVCCEQRSSLPVSDQAICSLLTYAAQLWSFCAQHSKHAEANRLTIC